MDYLPAKITETRTYYVQCVTAGNNGPSIGAFYPVIIPPDKEGEQYSHNGYMMAAQRTCDKLTSQRPGSEWIVRQECIRIEMATERYNMRRPK